MKLMDPAVQRDPAQMKKLAAEMRMQAHREVLSSVRLNGIIMFVLGIVLLGGGVVLGALGLLDTFGSQSRSTFLGMAATLGALGAAFAVLGRYFGVPAPMTGGAPGTATVQRVVSLGRTIGIEKPGISATLTKVTLALAVQPEQGSPYETAFSEFVVSSDLRYLQEGASVPVRIDPKRPTRIGIDWDRMG